MKTLRIRIMLFILTLLINTYIPAVSGQSPGGVPDDPSYRGHNGTVGSTGGSAPISSGLTLMIGLIISYGGIRIYRIRKEDRTTL